MKKDTTTSDTSHQELKMYVNLSGLFEDLKD